MKMILSMTRLTNRSTKTYDKNNKLVAENFQQDQLVAEQNLLILSLPNSPNIQSLLMKKLLLKLFLIGLISLSLFIFKINRNNRTLAGTFAKFGNLGYFSPI